MKRPFFHLLSGAVLIVAANAWPLRASAQQDVATPVQVIFTPDMSQDDLDRIQREVEAAGVELVYEAVDFRKGELQELSIRVNTPAGKGAATTKALTAGRPFGFQYDPRPRATVAFSIGTITPL